MRSTPAINSNFVTARPTTKHAPRISATCARTAWRFVIVARSSSADAATGGSCVGGEDAGIGG